MLKCIVEVKNTVSELIPIECGKFDDDSDWCVVSVENLLKFMLKQPKYASLDDKHVRFFLLPSNFALLI